MRRGVVIRVAVCIALGVATSVGIAWVFAAAPSLRPSQTPRAPGPIGWAELDGKAYLCLTDIGAGKAYYSLLLPLDRSPRLTMALQEVHLPAYVGRPAAGAPEERLGTTAYGWPLRVLKWQMRSRDRTAGGARREVGIARFNIPAVRRSLRLPLLPIWPGLLASTALYGSLWGALLSAPAPLRRTLRRRRGRCPRCAYDLRGLASGSPCPECGSAVRRRESSAA